MKERVLMAAYTVWVGSERESTEALNGCLNREAAIDLALEVLKSTSKPVYISYKHFGGESGYLNPGNVISSVRESWNKKGGC
jgi:hypothetical protein